MTWRSYAPHVRTLPHGCVKTSAAALLPRLCDHRTVDSWSTPLYTGLKALSRLCHGKSRIIGTTTDEPEPWHWFRPYSVTLSSLLRCNTSTRLVSDSETSKRVPEVFEAGP